MDNPLIEVVPGLMIWTLICFGITFYVLKRYAFGPDPEDHRGAARPDPPVARRGTLQREVVDLPEPPGPIGMYVCGPTVYARAHIGNARPFVVGSWYASWLRRRGYEVTLVHNITDVNDKIYEAAPGASAARAAEATEWYLEDVARFGLEEVDHYPKVTDTMDEIIAFIADLIERGFAYEVEGDVYFRVARVEGYGRLSGPAAGRGRGAGAEPAQGRSTRLRALEGQQAGRGHGLGRAVGARPAGLAHRVLGDGGAAARPGLRDPRRRARPRLPAPRERARAVPCAGNEFARIWMHNGMLRFTGEKMSKSVGNVETIEEVLDEWGPETTLALLPDGALEQPDRLLRGDDGGGARTRGGDPRGLPQPLRAGARGRLGALRGHAGRRLQHARRARARARVARPRSRAAALDVFGLAALAEEETAPAELDELAGQRQQAREDRDFAEADRLRVEIEAAGWDVRDDPDGYRLIRRS